MQFVKMIKKWGLPLFCLALMISICDACPTCSDTLSENDIRMVHGYFWSIIFMMSMPFLILGSLLCFFYWQVVKAKAAQETTQIPATSAS